MALERAGVSLEAEGFNKYIRQLGEVDKAQQDIFNADARGVTKAFDSAARAANEYGNKLNQVAKKSKTAETATKGVGLAAAGAAGAGIAAVSALSDAIVGLGAAAANTFVEVTRGGVALNQQFELSEKVFSNVFGDPKLGKATVDFLNETSDRLRVARGEAAQFAQTILPRTGGLDEFTELLRLTDIQADTTGQTLGELEFSIREALSGDFVSLKDRFDLGTEQINRIKALTPELGRSQALIQVLTEEFTRLGKTDISGTLGTNIKDLQSTFTGLQATLGKPTFEQLRIQSQNLLDSLNRNEKGLERTAIALGEVTANVVELVGTEIVEFIDSLDFRAIETGIDNVNAFVESLRVVSITIKEAFQTGVIQTAFGLLTGNVDQLLTGINKVKQADFGQSFQKIGDAVENASQRQNDYKERVNAAASAQSNFNKENEDAINDFLAQSSATDQATKSIESYQSSLKRAEQLQLSFSRAAEDAALKLARQNEDVSRKQAKSVRDLEERQAKDRDKLLKQQQKQLDKFEAGRLKQISKAESNIQKEREKAAEQRRKDQQKLQRDLARAQERFNLSQLQSERRFKLSERRLRAEGDILGLQELREDRELERQEETENFSLNQKNRVQDASEKQREQTKDLDSRLKELKANLEDQRAELLTSFDEQLQSQIQAQQEARDLQQRRFAEEAEERQIALQREEEDRRISQQRQLEDLGRSFADQEGVTKEGTEAIAAELEKAFGIEGAADAIFTGFTDRTESKFKKLFENVGDIINKEAKKITKVADSTNRRTAPLVSLTGSPNIASSTPATLPEFNEGGIVPGPVGSPQLIQAHGGETVLPTHQRSFTMAAPVVPSQELNVNMSGGFNITGDRQADEAILQAATREMTDNFRIAVQRLERRN